MKPITFSERVLKAALSIPAGRVATYGAINVAAGGAPVQARMITSILGRAAQKGAKNIPFHRIVYSDGKVWLDEKHKKERLALFKKEKIEVDAQGRVKNFADKVYNFT